MITVSRDFDRELLAILDRLGLAGYLTDMEAEVRLCNTAACHLLERTEAETIGLMVGTGAFVMDEYKSRLGAAASSAWEVGDNTQLSVHFKTKKAEAVSLDLNVEPRRKGAHRVGSMLITKPDNGNKILDMLDRLGVAVWFTDKEGLLTSTNKTTEFITERGSEELSGHSLVGTPHP